MHRLHLIGLNHTTAPLDIRERLAFSPAQRAAATADFRSLFPDSESVILSTCNRVEVYTARAPHGHPKAEDVASFFSTFHQIDPGDFQPHLYHRSDRQMVEHLFSVASSLDSMVLGETQILGQVREAYDAAREAGAVGPLLNPLFQRAVAVGRQVLRETTIGDGRFSVASVAVDYAKQVFDHFGDKTVLCVGAGKMARLVLRSFAELSPGRLIIANRDAAKAAALATEYQGTSAGLDGLDDLLATVDVVITSTGATEPVITADRFTTAHRRRRRRPLLMIDIALPRDVEPAVGQFDNVYLYNLDDLQKSVAQSRAGRESAVDPARAIVSAAVDDYVRAHRARAMGPVIDKLFKRSHQLAAEEVARTLNKMPNATAADRQQVEELARRIVNKLMHDPVKAVRDSDALHGSSQQYLHAMERLFNLPGADEPGETE
jgi:glutamyl-tRNA reductase